MPRTRNIIAGAVTGVILLGAGIGIGAGTAHSTHTTTTVNHTVTQTRDVPVPGPTRTVIKTVPAPAPSQGSVIDTFHGTGNSVTPEFNVPSDGNYIVSWTFSNNGDGFGNGGNFIVNATGSDDDASGLANDIATSGHGSGEVQMAGSTDSLTVQAQDSATWTLTITSA